MNQSHVSCGQRVAAQARKDDRCQRFKHGPQLFTFQVHSGLETLPEAAGRTVLPADLVDDAVVSPCAQVVVLACGGEEDSRGLHHLVNALCEVLGGIFCDHTNHLHDCTETQQWELMSLWPSGW